MARRLFVSDLHLWDPAEPAFRAFESLMASASDRFDEVFLLGDLCEAWIGDDDDGALARSVVAVLARTAGRSRVFVMPGNRDFLFGGRFEAETGARLIPDPWPLGDGVLLAHGDAFCTRDAEYQQARRLFRSPQWQQYVLARPLTQRRTMAEGLRAASREANANKAENIMDVSENEIDRVMAEHGGRVLIHGHTHRPGIHQHPWGRRYVLGAWQERCGWRLEAQGSSAFSLVCFPLPRGRSH